MRSVAATVVVVSVIAALNPGPAATRSEEALTKMKIATTFLLK